MKRKPSTLLILALSAILHGQQAEFEMTDVFNAGENDYFTYRIPGIVCTTSGTLLAWCEARRKAGDWAEIDIVMRRSTDEGKTWSKMRVIAEAADDIEQSRVTETASIIGGDTEGATANNPVMIIDRKNNWVHFLFCIEYNRCFYAVSRDDGLSFSEPVEITGVFDRFRPEYDWKVIATGPGHAIQLKNGRLLVPLWMSTGEFENGHRPSVVATIYSDDYGRTWERGDIAVQHQQPYIYPENGQPQAISDPNESTLVQLKDGRVMLNSRTESPEHFRVITCSRDGSSGWSNPVFDPELFDPVCMGSLARHPGGILFTCPHTPDDPRRFGKVARARENLSMYLSTDEGDSWPVRRSLYQGISAYSDIAVGKDGTIYVLFERDGINGSQYQSKHLSLAKFNLTWLTE